MRRSIRGATFVLLAGWVVAAWACTPINDVKRASAEREAPSARDTGVEQAPDAGDDTTQTGAGEVVERATPCSEDGARACEGHGVREVSVCKDGKWTSDTACKASERCDSATGKCAPMAAVCAGQEAGAVFCDGERRLVCDDLVEARELPCGANQICSRKDGKVSCTCAPGAMPSAAGDSCERVSGCGEDGASGCDRLTQCKLDAANQATCTDCPAGYIGNGSRGCTPQLESLTVSCGADGEPRTMMLTPGVYEYRMGLPMLCLQVTLLVTSPASTSLEVDGATVDSAAPWTSPPLHIGENAIKVVVTSQFGRSSAYQLKLDRAGASTEYLKASNAESDDSFGFRISADGSTLIAGAPFEDSSPGASGDDNSVDDGGGAYAFELEAGKWVEKQIVKPDSLRPNDGFGMAVAVSGDILVVGAPRHNIMLFTITSPTQSGVAYVFTRQAGVWKQEAMLSPSNGGADMFGFQVSVHGETVVVGAPYDSEAASHAGAAYTFTRSGGAWTAQQKLFAKNPVAEASFGTSVSIEGDTLVVGAMQDPTVAEAAGSAEVFTRSAGTWTQQARLQAPSPRALATFGMHVTLHAGQVFVGAPGLDLRQRPTPAGEAYMFQLDPSTASWLMMGRFRAEATRAADLFGGAIAATSTAVIIGANGDASSARGADGDASRTDAKLAGAGYVFGLQGSAYAQSAYLKAFNAEEDDGFGHSVAATETFVAIAAPFESSRQRGVSTQEAADGASNAARSSGAVYVYR
jgi:hypothetical protein